MSAKQEPLNVLPKLRRAWEIADRAGLLASKGFVQRIGGFARPRDRAVCLLVAGVQRSGTNMVMDVLERSYSTEVYHERDPRAFENFQLREEQVIRHLISRCRSPLIVVKCLMESQKLAQLMDAFVPSRALWVYRDYRDVVNSMLRSFGNQAKQVRRIAADRNADGWLGECMSDATYALVAELATDDLDDASAAAIQWYFRNIRFYEQQLDQNPDVLTVHYDDLVTAPAEQFKRVFEFAGIGLSPRVLKHVSASSIRRRPPPVLRADVEALCQQLYTRLQEDNRVGPGVLKKEVAATHQT